MKLTDDLIPSFLRLIRPDAIEERSRRFRERVQDGHVTLADFFIRPDAGVAWLETDQPGRMHVNMAGDATADLLRETVARAREAGAYAVDLRTEPGTLSTELPALGFVRRHLRVEYKTPLAELPDETGTPLTWSRPADLARAARLLREAGEGDPDWNPDDDALALLTSYLEDPVLTSGPDCVHVGSLDDAEAAIVVAQVNPSTRWSRVTYMGMRPAFRRRGLGRWVHRHGFAMMRAQGGETYQGGTVETNRAMIRLFELHGCRLLRRLEEWTAQTGTRR